MGARGGTEVTYFPPVYCILAVCAQLFIFLPFHTKPPVVFFNDFKNQYTEESNKLAYVAISFFPIVIGLILLAVLLYLLLTK